VPSKVAQADYDVYVSSNDAAVASLDGRVGGVEGSVSGLDSRVGAVEGELPNKALSSDLSALDARVVSVEGSFVGKLVQEDAADYNALFTLGANKIGKISSSPLVLAENAPTNTILFVLAGTALSITSAFSPVFEMLEGEFATLAKNESGWVALSGVVPLSVAPASAAPPPPPPPSYPAAWASLGSGGYTAVYREATSADVPQLTMEQLYPEGHLIEVRTDTNELINSQTNYVWFETAGGKVGAGTPGLEGTQGFFTSLDTNLYPLASITHVLVSLGGVDVSDEGVSYRIAVQ
jgi:hypothetical protein